MNNLKKWAVIIACVLYVLSPIDLLPEAILGPFGLPDDLVAIFIAIRALFSKGGRQWSD